jgi:hypothetical protein
MIFSKGEKVKVSCRENPFYEKVGIVIKVTIDSLYPFKVEFCYDKMSEFYLFSHDEIEVFDTYDTDKEMSRHYKEKNAANK